MNSPHSLISVGADVASKESDQIARSWMEPSISQVTDCLRRIIIGGILGFSGYYKITHIESFYGVLEDRFHSELVVFLVTFFIPAWELSIAGVAFLGGERLFIAAREHVVGMALVFLFYHLWNLGQPAAQGCGCFGSAIHSEFETTVSIIASVTLLLASFDTVWFWRDSRSGKEESSE